MLASIPPVTRALLIANVAVFFAQAYLDPLLVIWFALWPLSATSPGMPGVPTGFLPWQIVTYSFLHGNSLHLLFNMLGVFMFGSEVERVLGHRRYVTYYFVSVLVAGVSQLVTSALSAGPPFPTIGASGGVFGLLLAYGIFFPRRIVMLIFPPIPMPAWLFVIVYAAVELYLGVTGTQAGVAHFAHLGGMLGGYLMLRHWRRRRFDSA
ncbi:MAG: rhomboid family intramembrane serine protease [Betaproteobacteria bacterium RIFCSPLOWO2_02_FULL_67_26]|nr:MAG: rhomboid family intramembrane serine protease [Betaproteobacteria bacterium RIFCSPLOWO2_02_FULL_67_26]